MNSNIDWQDPNQVLPDEGVEVLVIHANGYPYIAFYSHKNKEWENSSTEEYMSSIKWWSYVPKAPDE